MSEPPSSIDWVGPCDLCAQPASWRSTPKAGESEFTAIVTACTGCGYVYVDPGKAVPRPVPRPMSALGWLAERVAG